MNENRERLTDEILMTISTGTKSLLHILPENNTKYTDKRLNDLLTSTQVDSGIIEPVWTPSKGYSAATIKGHPVRFGTYVRDPTQRGTQELTGVLGSRFARPAAAWLLGIAAEYETDPSVMVGEAQPGSEYSFSPVTIHRAMFNHFSELRTKDRLTADNLSKTYGFSNGASSRALNRFCKNGILEPYDGASIERSAHAEYALEQATETGINDLDPAVAKTLLQNNGFINAKTLAETLGVNPMYQGSSLANQLEGLSESGVIKKIIEDRFRVIAYRLTDKGVDISNELQQLYGIASGDMANNPRKIQDLVNVAKSSTPSIRGHFERHLAHSAIVEKTPADVSIQRVSDLIRSIGRPVTTALISEFLDVGRTNAFSIQKRGEKAGRFYQTSQGRDTAWGIVG